MSRLLGTVLVGLAAFVLTGVMSGAIASAHPEPATKPVASKFFAGYLVSKTKGSLTSATTTVVVPNITCKKSYSGVGPSIVVETKPNKKNVYFVDVAAVGVGCVKGKPEFESVLQVNGSSSNDISFAAGDKVTMTVTVTKSRTSVSVDDLTSGAHKTRTGAGKVGEYAYVGDQGLQINNYKTPLDPFTKTSFSGSEVNHKSLTAEKAVAYERKRGKTLLIAVSKLSSGKNFSTTFKHS
ncbi:MAG TPA: G1 family glutamic endopeptidase [Mycobacteriales bacterium]|nr:G1 family glutamic endopeptidase [Mycobacteriales bacterium]